MTDKERQSMNRGGADWEGDTESETDSRLWAVNTELDAGLAVTNCEIMTWAKVGRLTGWATQASREIYNHTINSLSSYVQFQMFDSKFTAFLTASWSFNKNINSLDFDFNLTQ